MKKVLFLLIPLLLLVLIYSCNSTETPKQPPANVDTDSANFTTVKWNDTAINFGTINKGEKAHVKYICTNTGNKPLFIYYAHPSCGCTVANYTKEAIMPGKTGVVEAEFDSNHGNAVGEIHKSITVKTNTTNVSPKLTFTGIVKQAAGADTTKKSS
jgi:hypothetical protein